MTTALALLTDTFDGRTVADIEVVIPVYNEEKALETSVRRLRRYLDSSFPFPAVITIADNASTDRTWEIASQLSRTMQGVHAVHLVEKGRGRALRAVWSASEAEVVAYMDVDLSTDLDALLPLVAPLISGHSDLAIGTRLAKNARVVRGPKREVISRCYNLFVRATLHNGFSDAQCGFKAMRRDAAEHLLPLVLDNEWFFDTELLVLAERNGLRIYEVPVDWVDDPDSRVHIASTAIRDVKGVYRMARTSLGGEQSNRFNADSYPAEAGELVRFAGVGVVSTIIYAALFLVLHPVIGIWGANAASLAICTIGNTVAHGRVTFRGRHTAKRAVQLAGSAVVFLTTVILTTAALGVVVALTPGEILSELLAIVVGTALAAFVRFIVLKSWVFRTHIARHVNA
jgi:putative flippase GtrA